MDLSEHLDHIHGLDDDALLHSLKRFVASSNHLTALVLAHLAEVDARGAYRKWACDTLMTYCVYELRPEFSAPARRPTQSHVPPVPNSRHLPAAVRRAVWQRDQGQCRFIDQRGVRCRATAAIEFHHDEPHARGGPNTIDNVSLRCRAHNDLAAEEDFGRAFMKRKKHAATHDCGNEIHGPLA